MSSVSEIWNRLRTEGSTREGLVRLRIPDIGACAAYAARRIEDDLEALVLEVATASITGDLIPVASVGFEIHAEPLVPGRGGRTRLRLSLTDRRYRDVFHALAGDIVEQLIAASSEREAVRSLSDRLAKWQAFLRKHRPEGLTAEQRRGLHGELILLRDRLLPICEPLVAVRAWKGCRGANHDYQLAAGSIEVKTTSASTPHSFHVSNVLQLDDSTVPCLYLFLVLVEESDSGQESLPELVDALRGILDGAALALFDDCLLQAGFLMSQREQYDAPRYSLRSTRLFEVREGFPRLLESQLPRGVENVRYMVAVAACTDFQCDDETSVFSMLCAGTTGDE